MRWGDEGVGDLAAMDVSASCREGGATALHALVFLLVAAMFSTICRTQPILPVLREEFRVAAGLLKGWADRPVREGNGTP